MIIMWFISSLVLSSLIHMCKNHELKLVVVKIIKISSKKTTDYVVVLYKNKIRIVWQYLFTEYNIHHLNLLILIDNSVMKNW